jgi:hypothetical protein
MWDLTSCAHIWYVSVFVLKTGCYKTPIQECTVGVKQQPERSERQQKFKSCSLHPDMHVLFSCKLAMRRSARMDRWWSSYFFLSRRGAYFSLKLTWVCASVGRALSMCLKCKPISPGAKFCAEDVPTKKRMGYTHGLGLPEEALCWLGGHRILPPRRITRASSPEGTRRKGMWERGLRWNQIDRVLIETWTISWWKLDV